MTESVNALVQLSQAFVGHGAAAAHLIAAVRISAYRNITGVLWRPDVVVTSEQSLPTRPSFNVVLASGESIAAKLAGRDPGTNLAVLQLERSSAAALLPQSSQAQVGELVLAYGADANADVRARLGIVNAVGPQWHSQAGGRIDARIVLDIELRRSEEGGPVLNAAGEFIGMSTYGRRGEVLVIPAATIERVSPMLLQDGHVARGWLGLALQPVAIASALREAAGHESGMMVMSVVENGPGAAAGIVAGDTLLTVDGVHAVHLHRVAGQLDADSVGRTLELRIIRGGAAMTVPVAVSKRPAA